MPIHQGKDINGYFWAWGSQHKYYYNPRSKKSSNMARMKAVRQAQAIYSHGYRKKVFS